MNSSASQASRALCTVILCLALSPVISRGQNQTINGNLTVTGTVGSVGAIDSDANSLTFGTQGASYGAAFMYQDASVDTFTFNINRSPASWLWQHNTAVPAMRLSNLHELLLYQADGTTAGVSLLPASKALKLGATATLTGDTSGTLSTSGAFTVGGNLTSTNGTFTGAGAGLTFNAGGTNQNITLVPTGTGYIYLNGKVGIKKTPVYDLDVNGQINADALYTANLSFAGSAGSVAKDPTARIDFTSLGGLISDNPFWRGIHLASPLVTVNGANTFPRTSLYYSATTFTDPTDLQFNLVAGNSSSNTGMLIASEGTGPLKLATNGLERFRIDQNGNIGIGTSAPSSRLEILDGTAAAGTIARFARNSKALEFVTGSPVDLQIGTPGNHSLGFYTNGNDPLLTLTAGQRLGIGTTIPASTLQLSGDNVEISLSRASGDINAYPRFGFSTNFDSYWSVNATYASGAWNYVAPAGWGGGLASRIDQAAGSITFDTVNGGIDPITWNSRLVITNAGNVGIGTTTPSHKLAVKGTIRAQEVIVDTGWADYVFDDDYRLAPLSEVETRIKADRHLPGLPSAAEVAAQGVSMGDMQSKLLSKIEELTLHLIAQEKQMAAQANRLDRLETENRQLRAQHGNP